MDSDTVLFSSSLDAPQVPPPESSPLQTFTPFPRLPTELRLKIWSYTIQPRVLILRYNSSTKAVFTHQTGILQACAESREVGLSHYFLSFKTDKHAAAVYYNNKTDILYFGHGQSDDEIEAIWKHFENIRPRWEHQKRVKRIAMAEYLWRRDYKAGPFCLKRGPWCIPDFSRLFDKLDELILVKGEEKPESDDIEKKTFEEGRKECSGLQLFRSEFDEEVPQNEAYAVRACKDFFASRRRRWSEEDWADVTAMELVRA